MTDEILQQIDMSEWWRKSNSFIPRQLWIGRIFGAGGLGRANLISKTLNVKQTSCSEYVFSILHILLNKIQP